MHKIEHQHSKLNKGKRLLGVTLLNLSITIVQIIGGIVSNSLSLLSDAFHNLGDSFAIFIAYIAEKVGNKQPNYKKTFGYKRIEILAALFNAVMLIAICLYLFFEAYHRFFNPSPIKSKIMLIVATFGLLANLISIFILNKEKGKNLNIHAAYLHLLGDTLSSVAVILGGLAMLWWQVYWVDPLITILVGIFIIWHAWKILKDTVNILMQTVPANMNIEEIKQAVEAIGEVNNLHHLHVWQLDDSTIHLEAHVDLRENMLLSEMMLIKEKIAKLIKEKFAIQHITLEIGYHCCPENSTILGEK